ncbi:Peptidase A24A prepilin type IV FlaK [Methanonatronarchaeum thermophilum]|uniref:Peptidase A24A prepilin type IV FlaK n=1 Tax=Methanonatronarchaeum thermophilum TaxID=1927129 RepID=A0A1Y3GEG1_9EURY|nr:A24 family peptidase [Methanonatronarchaeum thermophilum]OUJ18574.1 Peptidase A24A prepilin type IV FlaK [Methanonatronarchaeum thermophilum]
MDLDLIKILIVLPFFIIACFTDLKDRKVPNKLWIPLIIIAVVFLALQYNTEYITMLGISLLVIAIIVFIMAALRFGGADLKALIVIAILFPTYPETFNPTIGEYSIFALTTIVNGLFIALIYPIAILITNIIKGDTEKPSHLFTSIKKPTKKVTDKERVYHQGQYKTLSEEEVKTLSKTKNKVWVTPWIPFIVFITLGLIVALTIGDLLYITFNYLT